MKNIRIQYILVQIVILGLVACSPKQFSKDPEYHACQNLGSAACVNANGLDIFTVQQTVQGGKLDVVIINDNSGSMSYDQTKIAEKFASFVQQLDSHSIDYRIGIITTDSSVSFNNPARAINKNGALQDGRLIQFPNGEYFLTSASGDLSQKNTWFQATLKRTETQQCENFVLANIGSIGTGSYNQGYYDNCPSGDERGIYTLNNLVNTNDHSFFRTDSDKAFVVVANENIRSDEGGLALEDTANNFVNTMRSKYPNAVWSFHSIVVEQPYCKTAEDNYFPGIFSSSYGTEYLSLTSLSHGIRGDICKNDYTGQLAQIFDNVTTQLLDRITLACATATLVTTPGQAAIQGLPAGITSSIVGSQLVFNPKIPVNTTIQFKYSCPALN